MNISGAAQAIQLAGGATATIPANSSMTSQSLSVGAGGGGIRVDSSGSLVVGGATTAFSIAANSSFTKSGTGALTISGTQSHGSGASVTNNSGVLTLNSDGGSAAARVLTINANSTTNFGSTQHLAALNIGAGAAAQLTSGGAKVLVVGALSVSATGKLDLTDNDLIIRAVDSASAQAALTSVRSSLASGINNGAWNGNGLNSSTAAANTITALGVLLNSGNQFTSFSGESVDAFSVLVKYTYYGDADLNGMVNSVDVAAYNNGVQNNLSGWANGDFNHSGTIDSTDQSLMNTALASQGGPL